MAPDGGEKGKQLFGVRTRLRQPDRPPVRPRPVSRRGTVITSLAERRSRRERAEGARQRRPKWERNNCCREREREGHQRQRSGSSYSSTALLSHSNYYIHYTRHTRTPTTTHIHTHTYPRTDTHIRIIHTHTHIHTHLTRTRRGDESTNYNQHTINMAAMRLAGWTTGQWPQPPHVIPSRRRPCPVDTTAARPWSVVAATQPLLLLLSPPSPPPSLSQSLPSPPPEQLRTTLWVY